MPLLDWLNKNQAVRTAARVPFRLLETVSLHGDANNDNWLIRGDNLEALKALLPFYAGRVKCIYIDPPYNTKSAFEHYDDNLEHSQWLSMIYPRLELLRELLAEDGSIWVSIDDNEAHYLKVVMDEVFGRGNFVANVVWEKVYSERMDARSFSSSHDHILVYQKSCKFSPKPVAKDQNAAQFGFFDPHTSRYYRRRSLRKEGSESLRQDRPSMWYSIEAPDGREIWPIKPDGTEGRWRWKSVNVKSKLDELEFVEKEGRWEIYVKQYLEENPTRPPATLWASDDVGHNHEAKLEVRSFNSGNIFDTPKPERLINRILHIATNPGDLVLDSFLGSGTTAAVAHKMGRRWIGIEMGEHAETHCLPRLEKVVGGEQGGVSAALGWSGGGGFRFFRLGEAVFEADGRINAAIRFPTLAAWIWYQETRQPWATPGTGVEPTPLLGIHEGCAYYLLYNGILGDRRPQGGNVLTGPLLTMLEAQAPHTGPRVIYGESCRLSAQRLKAAGIVFKQIPYDIRAR